jgi:hypothetical protein
LSHAMAVTSYEHPNVCASIAQLDRTTGIRVAMVCSETAEHAMYQLTPHGWVKEIMSSGSCLLRCAGCGADGVRRSSIIRASNLIGFVLTPKLPSHRREAQNRSFKSPRYDRVVPLQGVNAEGNNANKTGMACSLDPIKIYDGHSGASYRSRQYLSLVTYMILSLSRNKLNRRTCGARRGL